MVLCIIKFKDFYLSDFTSAAECIEQVRRLNKFSKRISSYSRQDAKLAKEKTYDFLAS